MSYNWKTFVIILILSVSAAYSQSNTRKPNIGYLYPAGGGQGSVVQVTAGGQFLNNPMSVHVSGRGVHATVIKYMKPFRNFNQDQRQLLQTRLEEVRNKRLAESQIRDVNQVSRNSDLVKARELARKAIIDSKTTEKQDAVKAEGVTLPDHPLLYDLDNKSLRELAHITAMLTLPRKKQQPNRQISESVLISIAIDPQAEPGTRELRIVTRVGMTNPILFKVGQLPEICELEPNNKTTPANRPNLPKDKPIVLPAVINGQIMPGDVDCFRFHADRGQQLVIEAQARGLIPYLADAVPGWFQATLTLYDADGAEAAFADDNSFNPDPVLFYQIPKSGEYSLEIRDAIYRGRGDFIYRISIGELPFITSMFPLGSRVGVKTIASIDGWNLSQKQLTLDTRSAKQDIMYATGNSGKLLSNSVAYAVDTLPECIETESNNTINDAERIKLPITVNGRIDKSGDIDVFQLNGRAGDKVVAEVYGRRLNSSLDSLLRLTDSAGNILEWNDDHILKDEHLHKDNLGLVTHHADSYLTFELPKAGAYYVHLTDAQHHGGAAYGYRLRIAYLEPDFSVRVTPSSLSVNAGSNVPVDVYALRKDGFDGDIEISLKDAPAAFKLGGGRIPAGQDHVRVTIKAPPRAFEQPIALHLEGRAKINGQTVSHLAVPAEDMMQAFLYRHLVPAQELLVAVKKPNRRVLNIEPVESNPVRIPIGGSANVRFSTIGLRRQLLQNLQLELNNPPDGLTIQDVTILPRGLILRLYADKDIFQKDFKGNIIIEVFTEIIPIQQEGKPAQPKRRVSMGFLPAIPIVIVPR
ncbi:hypothetical protein ACFL02_00500 [Planctomycetota bacterium]